MRSRVGTGEIGSLNRGFVISRFIFHIFAFDINFSGPKNTVRYTEDFVI